MLNGASENRIMDDSILVHSRVGIKNSDVPVWCKTLLSLEEASKYTGVGIHKLREISNTDDCRFVVWNGSKRLFKRRLLDEYLENTYSI